MLFPTFNLYSLESLCYKGPPPSAHPIPSLPALLAELDKLVGPSNYALVGSRVICNPPPRYADLDILISPQSENEPFLKWLYARWTPGGSRPNRTGPALAGFESWRWEQYNIVICGSMDHFHKFIMATAISKELNILDKHTRVRVCHSLLYGDKPPQILLDYFNRPLKKLTP